MITEAPDASLDPLTHARSFWSVPWSAEQIVRLL